MTTRKKSPLMPTAASEWKLPEPRLVELPSGRVMLLRPGPCMGRLVREGVIPNPLLGVEIETLDESDTAVAPRMDWQAREAAKAAIVCAMAVDPPVAMDATNGSGASVPYDAIDERDTDYIVAVAQEGAPDLARFRDE